MKLLFKGNSNAKLNLPMSTFEKSVTEPSAEEQKRIWLDREGKGVIPPLKEK